MANGKQPVLVCFLSPDLQIKIVQKSAKPPHIQHPALPTFSETTARRKWGGEKRQREKKQRYSYWQQSAFCLQCIRVRVSWTRRLLSPFLLQMCLWAGTCAKNTRACLSFLYACATRIAWGGEFTGDIYILCAYLRQRKRLQTVKIYCTVKLAKIMTTVRKKIMRAKFGSGGRILWCLDSNLTPDWVLRIKWTKYIIHPKSACQR